MFLLGTPGENLFPHLFHLLEAAGPISWLMGPSSTFKIRNVASFSSFFLWNPRILSRA